MKPVSMLNAKSASSRVSDEELSKILNTALVCTRAQAQRDFSSELVDLMKEPAYAAMLQAIRSLAEQQGVSENEAAESLIHVFRRADRLWRDYLFQEGVDRIKS